MYRHRMLAHSPLSIFAFSTIQLGQRFLPSTSLIQGPPLGWWAPGHSAGIWMRQWMFYHLVFHQVIPVNRLLHLILPLKFSAELNVVTMSFPLGLHLPAHHPALRPIMPPHWGFPLLWPPALMRPLPILGPLHQGDKGDVTVFPDAFREPGSPLCSSPICKLPRTTWEPQLPSCFIPTYDTRSLHSSENCLVMPILSFPVPWVTGLGHSGWAWPHILYKKLGT